MKKQLFLIEYESAHWCGGVSHCVVWAHNKDDAVDEASIHMEEEMRELFSAEIEEAEEEGETASVEDCQYTVNSVEAFGPEHEDWEFFQNPSQAQFYPVIGSEND